MAACTGDVSRAVPAGGNDDARRRAAGDVEVADDTLRVAVLRGRECVVAGREAVELEVAIPVGMDIPLAEAFRRALGGDGRVRDWPAGVGHDLADGGLAAGELHVEPR